MNTIISILLLILILCIIILIHEFGHFITAKKSGVYVYEFSLGFGPKLWSFKRKNDETTYSVRAIPLGGYVSMAGETNSQEDDKGIAKEQRLINKGFLPRMIVLLAGVFMNFVLAFVVLFVSACIYGAPNNEAIIGQVEKDSPAYTAGLEVGDKILYLNDKKIESIEDLNLEITILENKGQVKFTVQKEKLIKRITVDTEVKENEDGTKSYYFGFGTQDKRDKGFKASINYAFSKFDSIVDSMLDTLKYLFNGRVSPKELSGPIGIYTVVDQAKTSFENILYLIAFLSVNVGIVNLIPVPVFDGGRALLLVIEKLKGSKLNENLEYILDLIGFGIMILLMVYVAINDIFKLI